MGSPSNDTNRAPTAPHPTPKPEPPAQPADTEATPASHQAKFRDAFRDHPAGVAIITATVDDEPVGVTVSSLASLSLEPLAVSFSLMKSTGSAGKLLRADSLLIHLLTAGQADVAASFAGSGAPKFAPEQGWETTSHGEPLLPSARTIFRARIAGRLPSGDATLVAANIVDVYDHPEEVTTSTDSVQGIHSREPLVFKGHKFYSLADTKPLA